MIAARYVRWIALAVVLLLMPVVARADSAVTKTPQYHLASGDLDRTYLLYRPANLPKTQPVPLVVMLHGGYGVGTQAERSYGWSAQADAHGFVVAYPDGIGRSWNAGGSCCGPAARDNIDDVGFITLLIQTIIKSENIDPHRIYLAGMSNGAALAYRYACEGTEPIAAIGSVSGNLTYDCANPRAISVLAIHGTEDKMVPLAGGMSTKSVAKIMWPPVQHTLDLFAAADRCGSGVSHNLASLQVVTRFCAERRQVKLILIAGAGHQWPGGKPSGYLADKLLDMDPPSQALNATDTLWRFFSRHQN